MTRHSGTLMLITKGICAVLCVYCAFQAKAGLAYYQGLKALENKDTLKAISLLEDAERQGLGSAPLEFALAETLYESGLAKKDRGLLKQARSRFEKLSERLPSLGKPRLYQALAIIAAVEPREKPGAEEREEVSSLLKKAVKREPGNLWIQFMASTTALSHGRFLSIEEKAEALEGLKKASAVQPEKYLEPSLKFLWQRYKRTDVLRSIIPRNHEAYKIFLDFLFAEKLLKEWHKTYGIYREMRTEAYQALCRKGEAHLAGGQYEQAEAAFQEALWLDPASPWGRTGYIISHYGHKMTLPDEKAARTFLKSMLERDLPIGELLPRLGPVIRQTGDAYLEGLYLLKINRPEEAVSKLRIVEAEKLGRYYLARAYQQIGDSEGARAVLLPASGENLNSREAMLLQELEPASGQPGKAYSAVPKAVQREPRRGWWSETNGSGPFFSKGKIGMKISLLPGPSRIFIPVRLQAGNGNGAVLLVRLGDQVLGTLFSERSVWDTGFFDVETQGGDFWLSAELLHDAEEGVELGDVLIKADKEGEPGHDEV